MGGAILVIVDRKEFEERLAGYYWAQPAHIQEGFVRAYGRPVPSGDAERRQAISDVVATMADAELGALAQHVVLNGIAGRLA